MVTESEYKHNPLSYWVNKKVRITEALKNGYVTVPTGTVCEVTGKMKGFTLRTLPCVCCGVAVHLAKVPFAYVEIVETSKVNRVWVSNFESKERAQKVADSWNATWAKLAASGEAPPPTGVYVVDHPPAEHFNLPCNKDWDSWTMMAVYLERDIPHVRGVQG